jgi:hypothetical protein
VARDRRVAKSSERSSRIAAERLGAAILGSILKRTLFSDISQNRGFECSAPILPGRSQESASRRRGAGELEAYPEPSRRREPPGIGRRTFKNRSSSATIMFL